MALVRTRPLLPDVVRSELRRAIVGGEFPPGSKLPNEEALCTRFNVSRITLREAVRGLIEDGKARVPYRGRLRKARRDHAGAARGQPAFDQRPVSSSRQ